MDFRIGWSWSPDLLWYEESVEESFETRIKSLALSYARGIDLNKLMPIVISLICERR